MATCKITVRKTATGFYTKIPETDLTDPETEIVKKAIPLNAGVNKLSLGTKGHVKFIVPSDGTYKFTFTAINRTPREKYGRVRLAGTATFRLKTKDYIYMETQGGYNNSIEFCSSKTETYNSEDSDKSYWRIPNRYAKIKLKKGQQLFIYLYSYSYEYVSDTGFVDIPLNMKVTVKKQ